MPPQVIDKHPTSYMKQLNENNSIEKIEIVDFDEINDWEDQAKIVRFFQND
jgi:hypothetical protein